MSDLFDTVIGADVAETLGYKIGDPIVVAHGLASFTEHKDQPFKVSGILEKTGTPVDRTVIVSLRAIEAIHVDWKSGAQVPGQSTPVDVIRQMELKPKAVTAALICPAGALADRWHCRDGAYCSVGDGGGHGSDRNDGNDLFQPQRAAARNGDFQGDGRAATGDPRDAGFGGGGDGGHRRGARDCPALSWADDRATGD